MCFNIFPSSCYPCLFIFCSSSPRRQPPLSVHSSGIALHPSADPFSTTHVFLALTPEQTLLSHRRCRRHDRKRS
ncbi:hypothetical protein TSUD_374280 [Trifolium subterraneum]|uniref:Uncharacterized protein n=1 Tax=Trifolium subterraneum TaxID=3900 RepID=A0A2Z6PQG2_TRISU|nr:hypothetical protein TSUD_374280 [Trifolium subterraneum]